MNDNQKSKSNYIKEEKISSHEKAEKHSEHSEATQNTRHMKDTVQRFVTLYYYCRYLNELRMPYNQFKF